MGRSPCSDPLNLVLGTAAAADFGGCFFMVRFLLILVCLSAGLSGMGAQDEKISTRPAPFLPSVINDQGHLEQVESEIDDYSNWLIRFYRRNRLDLIAHDATLVKNFLAELARRVEDPSVAVALRKAYLVKFGELGVAFFNAEAQKNTEVSALKVRFPDVILYAQSISELKPLADALSVKFCEFLENYALSSGAGFDLVVAAIERHHFAPAVALLEAMILNEGEPTRKIPARAALLRLALAENSPALEKALTAMAAEHLRLSCRLHIATHGSVRQAP